MPLSTPSEAPAGMDRRKLVTLWCGVLYAIVLYGVAMWVIPRYDVADDPALAGAFTICAVLTAAVSFLVRLFFSARARERQRPGLRRTGQIVAIVVADAASLWGFALWIFTASPRSFWILAIGFVATLLHYPAREREQGPDGAVLP